MSPSHWLPRFLERSSYRSRNLACLPIGVGLCLSLMSGQAWSHEGSGQDEGSAAIVAAGFGYQNGVESTITVKVYDALSGKVLSEEEYDLDVKEDQSARSNSLGKRIFAGGVGLGATDLSNFVVRVYDAKTGEFQWTGQLNLTPNGGSRVEHTISTMMAQRAVVTKIHAARVDAPHLLFVLRAVDLSTGRIIWEDKFSANGKGPALANRVAAALDGVDGTVPGAAVFDLKILMLDRSGRAVLWEDRVLQWQAEEDSQDAVDDQAQKLPMWAEPIEQDSTAEGI